MACCKHDGTEEPKLTIQIVCPENEEEQKKLFSEVRDAGFDGVELHISPEMAGSPTSLISLREQLSNKGLCITQIATGKEAGKKHLSMCSNDKELRKKTADFLNGQIELAAAFGAGLILGTVKGNDLGDEAGLRENFVSSLKHTCDEARKCGVAIYLEATNHNETRFANTLSEAAAMIREVDAADTAKILPDTYHMNIEEADPIAALVKIRGMYDEIHLSDNNRGLPGFGGIDFYRYLSFLEEEQCIRFWGFEGNIHSYTEDLATSNQLIRSELQSIRLRRTFL
ncbi:MAG: sugar phosphate isomerase/epimerase family protein [Eubacteriales bacterium]|jgi:sugar phosphate isomerase/epimerase